MLRKIEYEDELGEKKVWEEKQEHADALEYLLSLEDEFGGRRELWNYSPTVAGELVRAMMYVYREYDEHRRVYEPWHHENYCILYALRYIVYTVNDDGILRNIQRTLFHKVRYLLEEVDSYDVGENYNALFDIMQSLVDYLKDNADDLRMIPTRNNFTEYDI